jgi:hypothetical protein
MPPDAVMGRRAVGQVKKSRKVTFFEDKFNQITN